MPGIVVPNPLSRAAAIAGAAEAKEIGYPSERKTSLQLAIEAIKAVSDQTGIPISRINGIGSAGVSSSELAEHMGLHPAWIDTTSVGGCSFEIHVHHLLAAIYAGIVDVGLVVLGQAGWSPRALRGLPPGAHRGARAAIDDDAGGGDGPAAGQASAGRGPVPGARAAAPGEARGRPMPGRPPGGGGDASPGQEMTMAYGLSGAPSSYSHAMTRHNYRFGSTPEDFAHIAVVTREWATLNPRAVMHSKKTHENGGPITVEDVQNARMISWPLTLLHCCLVTDYGGAVLVTSPEIARSLPTRPVWIAGAGENMSHSNMLEMEDFTATSAAASGATAYRMAGMGPGDMEMAMVYDSFTVTAGITAEMLGLAPRGEGFMLWKDGRARPGGTFPINTNGGGLSFNHSGMYGMQLLVEAYRQLSRTAEDGINGLPGKQTNARSCIVNGTGGSLSTTGTLVLTAD